MPDPSEGIERITKQERDRVTKEKKKEVLLAKSRPTSIARGVIFLIGLKGHRNAGWPEVKAKDLERRSIKFAVNLIDDVRKERQIEYSPFEIHEFNSLRELISKRPKESADNKWHFVVLVTHASGAAPYGSNSIFLGDREYTQLDLLDFVNQHQALVDEFRGHFSKTGNLRIVACGPGAHGPDLGLYVREFFGLEGAVTLPKINVDLSADGRLGVPISEGSSDLRPIRRGEWLQLEPILPGALP